jgi:WD40 repeat protein
MKNTVNEFHSNAVWSVEHIPNTKYIISGSRDKTINIWNYETSNLVRTLHGHTEDVF